MGKLVTVTLIVFISFFAFITLGCVLILAEENDEGYEFFLIYALIALLVCITTLIIQLRKKNRNLVMKIKFQLIIVICMLLMAFCGLMLAAFFALTPQDPSAYSILIIIFFLLTLGLGGLIWHIKRKKGHCTYNDSVEVF